MPKFRKKPVVIEAIQFDGSNGHEIEKWARGGVDYMENPTGVFYMQIVTSEGTMRGDVNDWIIRGVKGELYPCKPDIFETTYDPVD